MQTQSQEIRYVSRQHIEDRARDVLREHGLESIPVDPVRLANRLGIKVHNAKFSDDNIVGMIAKKGDELAMLVNQADPPYRKRFTIAHELGHHFLHLTEDGEYVDSESNLFRMPPDDSESTVSPERRMEIQANQFAAALLMPADDVRRVWLDCQSIAELARIFNVSEEAIGIRVDQLGLE